MLVCILLLTWIYIHDLSYTNTNSELFNMTYTINDIVNYVRRYQSLPIGELLNYNVLIIGENHEQSSGQNYTRLLTAISNKKHIERRITVFLEGSLDFNPMVETETQRQLQSKNVHFIDFEMEKVKIEADNLRNELVSSIQSSIKECDSSTQYDFSSVSSNIVEAYDKWIMAKKSYLKLDIYQQSSPRLSSKTLSNPTTKRRSINKHMVNNKILKEKGYARRKSDQNNLPRTSSTTSNSEFIKSKFKDYIIPSFQGAEQTCRNLKSCTNKDDGKNLLSQLQKEVEQIESTLGDIHSITRLQRDNTEWADQIEKFLSENSNDFVIVIVGATHLDTKVEKIKLSNEMIQVNSIVSLLENQNRKILVVNANNNHSKIEYVEDSNYIQLFPRHLVPGTAPMESFEDNGNNNRNSDISIDWDVLE